MKPYMLVRDGIPISNAVLAAALHKDRPELVGWITGSPEISFRRVSDHEFERARRFPGATVLRLEHRSNQEVAIMFGPEDEREELAEFRELVDDDLEGVDQTCSITEEIWLNCDSRPLDLANYQMPHVDERTFRRFAVGCCDLVIHAMNDPRTLAAVEAARKAAEGSADAAVLETAFGQAQQAVTDIGLDHQGTPAFAAACLAMNATTPYIHAPTEDMPDGWTSLCAGGSVSDFLIWDTIRASDNDPSIATRISNLVREVCGNPFIDKRASER